ncbi:MAG TPA: choice-of-anchor D domain-containing protein, partial [Verrucomicrobiae bacterium]|nr:choice-of-anchor D domain-containing protein [Verrucomicrobiae bacterium]
MFGAEAHPRLSFSPSSFDFGDVPVGISLSQLITLRNTGNAIATVSAANLTGAGFSHDLVTPFTLAAGEFRSFNLTFAPTTAGSVMGGLSIVSNAENSPIVLTLTAKAAGPGPGSLTANPSSITFGDTVVGASATQTVSLTNGGGTAVIVNSVSVTGASFNVTGLATPLTLNPSQTISFSVRFFPRAAGAAAGSVSIASDAPNSPTIITLAGNGIAAVRTLNANPTNVDFGNVAVGSNSSQAVTLTNTGNADVTITAANVTGAGFSINPPLTLPLTLTPNQTRNFTVRFAPAATGAVAGSVSLVSNATNSPTTVALAGNGVAAAAGQLTANPTSVDFGDVIVGNTSNQAVMLTNTGNGSLTITAANVTGAGFSINPPLALPLTLTPGQSTNLTVRFAPAAAGSVNGSISLASNASNSPTNVALAGNGVAQVLRLGVNPTNVDFGDVGVGSTSSQSVTMTNTGNQSLTVTAANVAGAGFSINPPLALPLTLTPGQSSNFTVQFAPTATGNVAGAVSLVSNATNSPTTVTLAGNGV